MRSTRLTICIIGILLPLCLGFLTSGCATNKVDWQARIGAYTFDQAVLELGPPDKQATLTDGTRVADWMTRRGGVRRVALGYYSGYDPYCYGPPYPMYSDYFVPDYFLRLVFDSDGELKAWRRLVR